MLKPRPEAVDNPFLESFDLEEDSKGTIVISDLYKEEDEEEPELDSEESVATPESLELRERVKHLIKRMTDSYWELAEGLAKILNEKLYKQWGYSNFDTYVKSECGFERTKAYDLARIYNYYSTKLKTEFSDDPEKYSQIMGTIKDIGWNKALKVAKENVITKDNSDFFVEEIKSLSLDEIELKCGEMKDDQVQAAIEEGREPDVEKIIKKSFGFALYQLETVESALEKAKTTMKSGATDSSALSMICADFDSSFEIVRGGKADVVSYLSKVERLLGVRLIALNDDLSNILYGKETMEKIVSLDKEEK